MIGNFKRYCELLGEVTDSRNNREALIKAYALRDERQAGELIKQWNKYEKLIDPNQEYGFARSVKNLNPRDIFAWSRSEKFMNDGQPAPKDARANLLSMLENLKRVEKQREQQKQEQDNYEVVFKSPMVTAYIPRSEGASCKLGAGTKWCTAATKSQNMFNDYTKNKDVVLYYIFTKHDGKFAVAQYTKLNQLEVYDEEDNNMNVSDLESILKDHGTSLGQIVPIPTIADQLEALSDSYVRSTNTQRSDVPLDKWASQEKLDELLQTARELATSKPQEFQSARAETGLPDTTLLMGEAVSRRAIDFFFNKQLNPPGSMPDTNKRFQQLFLDSVVDYTDLRIRSQGSTGKLHHTMYDYFDEDSMHLLYMYSKRWMNGDWKELHGLAVDLVLETPSTAIEDNFTKHLIRMIMREKGGRFPELEQQLKLYIDQESKRGWNDNNARVLRFSDFYNRLALPSGEKILPTLSNFVGKEHL